jgi:hypothetical protein
MTIGEMMSALGVMAVAEETGLQTEIIISTSEGMRVPKHVESDFGMAKITLWGQGEKADFTLRGWKLEHEVEMAILRNS